MTDPNQLSNREVEILELVATGASNKEIANELTISVNTVKVHLRNIYTKMGVASRTEAAMWAVQNGLVKTGAKIVETVAPSLGEVESSQSWFAKISTLWKMGIIVGSVIVLVLLGYGISLLSQPSSTPAVQPPDEISVAEFEESRWKRLADMPTARAGLAAAAYDNRIYALAGEGVDGPVGANERYDPATDRWEILTPKPVPVADVHAGVIGGRIFVPGGRLPNGEVTDILEIYDPQNDTWSQGAPVPKAVSGYALATFEGELYLFGGWDGERYLNTVYVYDPGQGEWSVGTAMPMARAFACATVVGEGVYVTGGKDDQGALAVNEVYFPILDNNGSTKAWKTLAPLPYARYGAVSVNVADILFFIGGLADESGGTSSYVAEYFPQRDEWNVIAQLAETLVFHNGASTLGTKTYLFGGGRGQPQNTVWGYQVVYTVAIPVIR